ncbi:bile acid:Na+ symporter, BASS family [Allopseudospirillum japonicum]|uniref:Bile acid:Na+ symporter, BASS family n=1 Tax=Allopseudospirillum japonicum TaxID=64971 RepID=A0A1H6U852_9GAMM|nr:bile acid:sodium symporter family protein [Allopseudospirillum japonicum]SEI88558.1 bile acid:Na+ symporter, BASS family [Allopseudospirillum japonicum]
MASGWVLSIFLPSALFFIMLGMGLSLHLIDFQRAFTQPKPLILGLIAQFLFIPLLAWVVVTSFALPPLFAAGLMILSFAPSGATSNMLTFLSRGEVAVSISLTAISSLLIPFTMPFLAQWALNYWLGDSTQIQLPLAKTWLQLVIITLVPVSLGLWLRHRYPQQAQKYVSYLKPASIIFLLIVISTIVQQNWATLPQALASIAPAVLTLNIAALAAGWLWAYAWRLSYPLRTTLALEVGVQNGGTALVITLGILQNTQMSIAPVVYGILMLVPSLALGIWLGQRKALAP